MPIPEAQLPLTLDRVKGSIVQVPLKTGLTVIDQLGDRCGAAIADPSKDVVEFFIAAGDADTVDWPAGVTILGCLAWIMIPADRRIRPPGRHWVHRTPHRERATPADVLAAALHAASADQS